MTLFWEPLVKGKSYVAWRHRDCGGDVTMHAYADVLECQKCRLSWGYMKLAKMSAQDHMDRFEGGCAVTESDEMLVTVRINGKCFGALRPVSRVMQNKPFDGEKWEPFKF